MFRMEVSLLSHGDALSWFSCPLVVVVGAEDASYQLVYLLLFPALELSITKFFLQ
jgi:hypothetical protein